ncbi:MAG TPA: S-adenosylmethionine decarboxylase [Rhizomicrobium sp.]|nr:S-adenosylmethionine decarboxylase [Rhizomicrobium sp.]
MTLSSVGNHFGEHLTLDGYGGCPQRLDNPDLVKSALADLCRTLGMKALLGPVIASAPDNNLKDPGGWSGFLVIAESHISIHTFPKRRFLSADAYTCQAGLDTEAIVAFFTRTFALEEVETHFVKRGLRYPAHNIA